MRRLALWTLVVPALLMIIPIVGAPAANAAPGEKSWIMCHEGYGGAEAVIGNWSVVEPHFAERDRQAGQPIRTDPENVYDTDCSTLTVPQGGTIPVCRENADGTTQLRNLRREDLHVAFRSGDRRPGQPVSTDPAETWSAECTFGEPKVDDDLDTDGDTVPDSVEVTIGQRPDLYNGIDCRSAEPALVPGADLRGCQLQSLGADQSQGITIDLSGADLSDANLDYAFLYLGDFIGVTAPRLSMKDAYLAGVLFQTWDLQDANLDGTDTEGGIFDNITGPGLSMVDGSMAYASFSNSDLTGARLDGLELFRATILDSTLDRVTWRDGGGTGGIGRSSVRHADLSSSAFYYEDVYEVDFTGSTLDDGGIQYGSDLNLTNASMKHFQVVEGGAIQDSDWSGATWTDVTLSWVSLLGGTNWAQANVSGLTYVEVTCPDGSNSGDNTPEGCPA